MTYVEIDQALTPSPSPAGEGNKKKLEFCTPIRKPH